MKYSTPLSQSHIDLEESLQFEIHSSISSIPAQSWNSLLDTDSIDGSFSPFLEHSWLLCLEQSQCVSKETGWVPQHLSIFIQNDNQDTDEDIEQLQQQQEEHNESDDDRQILAYVPMYIKGHSQGEFIFDHSWADYAYSQDVDYYPKLLIGIPFTPVTGCRILLDSDAIVRIWKQKQNQKQKQKQKQKQNKSDNTSFDLEYATDSSKELELRRTILASFRRMIGRFLKKIVDSSHFSSVHLNFVTDEEASSFAGMLSTTTTTSSSSVKSNLNPGIIEVFLRVNDDDTNPNYDNKKNENENSDNESNSDHPSLTDPSEFDFLRRTSIQFHWENKHPYYEGSPYESFEEYLDTFKSKKRINIKRERRKIHIDENIQIDVIEGRDILQYDGLVERMYEIYVSTVEKMYWGNQYLTLTFFEMLCKESNFVDNLCFICAREQSANSANEKEKPFLASDVIAGTFNVVKDDVFYGRYWGCLKEVKHLHFEVCYWSAIEYCITKGLKRMEPGAGGGDYKWARGFDATLIHSVHYVKHPGLRKEIQEFLLYETEEDVETTEYLKARRLGQTKHQ